MIEIDGSLHSGSGTILRYAAALAVLTEQPFRMTHIRAKRDRPGLRAQHLQALQACAELSGGRVEGDRVGSREILFHPGKRPEGGNFRFDIGTAGSTTMLAFTLLPLALFAEHPSRFTLKGGLFQDFAPSAFHMQKVLLPLLEKMGAQVRLEIARPGYVPRGGGELLLEASPLRSPLRGLRMPEPGAVDAVRGIALDSHLEEQQVAERMASRSMELLSREGFDPAIEIRHDATALQRGATLLLWAETQKGCLIGADQAGKPGRRSEAIAEFVVRSLLKDLRGGATTDRHLADQLILFAALAEGTTEYRIPMVTDHVESNLWLVETFLGAKTNLENNRVKIEGIGFFK